MTESRCDAVQSRLIEAFFERSEPAETDRDHAAGCADCGALRLHLGALGTDLAADAPPLASDALVHQTLERARQEMARHDAAVARPPAGFPREVGRLVGAALLPLPLILLWNAAVLSFGGELLSGIAPAGLVRALGAGYVLAGATWLGCLFGSLPLVAHRQMRLRALEIA